ncbi:MAG TPA: tetratricopeptide repeat protein [Beijerinckiaceae bacterium]|nr:tetratricopeptide repeat protein [Beijerinckiaceae bacterium]
MNNSDLELGFLLHKSGQFAQARSIYEKFIRKNPRHYDAVYSLGLLHAQEERFRIAAELFEKATRLRPDSINAHYNRGVALTALNAHEQALASYAAVLRLAPSHANAAKNRIGSLLKLKRFADALAASDQWRASAGDLPEVLDLRGMSLRELDRLDEALDCHSQAFEKDPLYLPNLVNRGIVLRELARFDEAMESYDRALAVEPENADAQYNRGVALQKMGRPEEALDAYDWAIRSAPALAEAYSARGTALCELARFDEALASYDRAITLDPDYADAHSNKSLCLLLLGRFDSGWKAHEWRKKTFRRLGLRIYPQPEWTGRQEIAGKTLFVHWEQGFGDTIQFCRYALLAQQRGAKVILSTQDALMRLLTSLSPAIEIIDCGSTPPSFDYHIPALSLPLAFKTDACNIPAAIPYLRADPERGRKWRQLLGDHGFKIGVVWQGSQLGTELGKSFPVAALEDISSLPGVRLVSLQKHDGLDQLASLSANMTIETFGDDFDAGSDAFLDTAAVMESLDLVITADTSIAHLAGALGRPTWVALKHVPDWRWLLDRDDTPWYPTLRLFRQKRRDDWTSVFSAMRCELASMIDATKGSNQ